MKRHLLVLAVLASPADVFADGVGQGCSVAIGSDGRALISYYDGVNRQLKVAHCADLACTTATLTTLDPGGAAGGRTSVVIGTDGLGLIAYYGNGALKVAHCTDVACTSAAVTTLGPGGATAFSPPQVAIGADGLGVIVYELSSSVWVAHCTDVPCSGATLASLDSSGANLGQGRLTIGADGLPLIAWDRTVFVPEYYKYLEAVHCGDVACTSAMVTPIPLTYGPLAMTTGTDGLGLIVASGGRMVHCSNPACTAATSAGLTDMTEARLAIGVDGFGLIGIGDSDFGASPHDLRAAHCADVSCTSATVTTLDAASTVREVGLAIGADGLGLISYSDAPGLPGLVGSLKVAHCLDVACTSAALSTLDVAPPHTDLVLNVSASPDPVTLATLTYTLRVSNQGPLVPAQVTVQQVLPAAVTFQSATGPGWSCGEAGGVVTCTGPGPAVYGTSTILVTVTTPATPQTLSSAVTVQSEMIDQRPENDRHVLETVVRARFVELVALKSDGGAAARWGQPFTWTITARNDGFDEVAGAVVADVFPAGVTGVTWTCAALPGSSCPASGAGNLNVPVTLRNNGGRATFTATGVVSAGTLSLVNTVTIGVPLGAVDPFPANNSATATSAVEPTQAYLVSPCRVVDTRSSDGPALEANSVRAFAVAGECAIPPDARAVAFNVTAVNPGEAGNLRLYPAGMTAPLASALNFAVGRTRANNAIVSLGQGGQISVQCDMAPGSLSTTHLVVDVYAYFK